MGDFPLMTEHGTFIINGAERVIVSQLVRSPGVYFARTIDKTGAFLYSAQMIPNRGAWIEYETDANGVVYARIDRARKLPVTVLLRALGIESDEEITRLFGDDERVSATITRDAPAVNDKGELRYKSRKDQALIEIYNKLRPGEPPSVDSATSLLNALLFDPKRYDLAHVGRYKYNKKLALAGRVAGMTAGGGREKPLHRRDPRLRRRGHHPRRRRARPERRRQRDRGAGGGPRSARHRQQLRLPQALPRRLRSRPLRPVRRERGALYRARACAHAHRASEPRARGRPAAESGAQGSDQSAGAQARAGGRHRLLRQLPVRPLPRHRRCGRHRPPRQPPPALRGRAFAEPDPRGPVPPGARGQGAHGHSGPGQGAPAGSDQHPPGVGGHQGVLRQQPAFAVHGSAQPAGGTDPQAPPVRPRPRRPQPRPRFLRRARRALFALRPHLPHRDA